MGTPLGPKCPPCGCLGMVAWPKWPHHHTHLGPAMSLGPLDGLHVAQNNHHGAMCLGGAPWGHVWPGIGVLAPQ